LFIAPKLFSDSVIKLRTKPDSPVSHGPLKLIDELTDFRSLSLGCLLVHWHTNNLLP
jgi:hypothetical protein